MARAGLTDWLRSRNLPHAGLRYLLSTDGGTTGSLSKDVAIKTLRAYEVDRWHFSPRRFGARVDRIPLDRPIFLLGTQGASETIIGRCLRRNAAVVSATGNSGHWTGADETATIRNRMSRLPRALWGSTDRVDLPDSEQSTDQLYASDSLLPAYRGTAEDATARDAATYARFLREHLAVYAHDPRRARFIDKTHAYTVKIPLLAALLADARPHFVLVVRNPHATCKWIVTRKAKFFRSHVPAERRLELAAEHWRNAYQTALEDAREVDNVTFVRFEDFLADPGAVVRSLCEFVQLEFHEDMVPGPGQRRPFATLPGDRKWYPLYRSALLDDLTPAEEEIIGAACGELAERFGYEGPAPVEVPAFSPRGARVLAATRP